MGQKRCGMKAIRQVLNLAIQGRLSIRLISRACGVSRPTAQKYINAFAQSGLNNDVLSTITDSDLIERLTGHSKLENTRHQDAEDFFPYMLTELQRIGVTRELLWREYRERHPDGYSYAQFCEHFNRWRKKEMEVTTWMEHKAGDRMYVDFAGKKPFWIDPSNGDLVEAELFVALMGASQYTYAEPSSRSQGKLALANMPLSFRWRPHFIMPDCMKSAVTKGDKYDRILIRLCQFADTTAVIITFPHSPRDKA